MFFHTFHTLANRSMFATDFFLRFVHSRPVRLCVFGPCEQIDPVDQAESGSRWKNNLSKLDGSRVRRGFYGFGEHRRNSIIIACSAVRRNETCTCHRSGARAMRRVRFLGQRQTIDAGVGCCRVGRPKTGKRPGYAQSFHRNFTRENINIIANRIIH